MADSTDQFDESELPSMAVNTVIGGKYRLEGIIGRGGMGSVWSALHLGLGQRVAIKFIARRHASSHEARHRFDVEAKAAAQLRSRFAVQIYDNGETPDGTPYIVMELLEGESLAQRLERDGPLKADAALKILNQLARALSRAHSLGIIHRDLKPENIFLTQSQDGEGEIVKVLDFGVAKMKSVRSTASGTLTGALVGTPLFMSPEQARGLRTIDHRSDVYSFGVVAFTILTGRPPFGGEALGDLLVAICTQPLPSMHAAAPGLPPAADGWLARACAREPAHRYDSVEASFNGLCAALADARPTFAPPLPQPPVAARALPIDIGFRGGIAPTFREAGTPSGLMVSRASGTKRSVAPALLLLAIGLAAAGAATVVLLRRSPEAASKPSSMATVGLASGAALPAQSAATPRLEATAPLTVPAALDEPANVAQPQPAQQQAAQQQAALDKPSHADTPPRGTASAPVATPPRSTLMTKAGAKTPDTGKRLVKTIASSPAKPEAESKQTPDLLGF